MKTIPTKYNGITFRSRLEARWAVFLTRLEIDFDYEPEGYDLDGLHYLPDFWLPEQRAFLEIKPESPAQGSDALEKARRLATFRNTRVIILVGNPRHYEAGYGGDYPLCIWSDGEDFPYLFCECPHCHRIDLQFDGRADRIDCRCPKTPHGDKGYNSDSQRLLMAYESASTHVFWAPPSVAH